MEHWAKIKAKLPIRQSVQKTVFKPMGILDIPKEKSMEYRLKISSKSKKHNVNFS